MYSCGLPLILIHAVSQAGAYRLTGGRVGSAVGGDICTSEDVGIRGPPATERRNAIAVITQLQRRIIIDGGKQGQEPTIKSSKHTHTVRRPPQQGVCWSREWGGCVQGWLKICTAFTKIIWLVCLPGLIPLLLYRHTFGVCSGLYFPEASSG